MGLGEMEIQTTFDEVAGDAGIILIARLLALLHVFLGEALMLSLVRITWLWATLDESSSENGRNA